MAAAPSRPVPALSIHLQNFSATDPGNWRHLVEQAQLADRSGIDRLAVNDHVAFGPNLEAYERPELGGVKGGKQPTGADGHWLEPLSVLSMLAGVTTRVRLMTAVLQAALRRPLVLAKTAATIDVLSEGRLDLGIGVGWQKEEYDAAGLPFDRRGRLLNHTLEVCQRLWNEAPVTFDDEWLQAESVTSMPQPRQPGGVPIWVSGTVNPRVLDRIVRFGSGWIPWGPDRQDPVNGLTTIHRALTDAGRDPSGFEVAGGLPLVLDDNDAIDIPGTMEGVGRLVEAGITDFRLSKVPKDPAEAADLLPQVASAFRTAVGRTDPIPS